MAEKFGQNRPYTMHLFMNQKKFLLSIFSIFFEKKIHRNDIRILSVFDLEIIWSIWFHRCIESHMIWNKCPNFDLMYSMWLKILFRKKIHNKMPTNGHLIKSQNTANRIKLYSQHSPHIKPLKPHFLQNWSKLKLKSDQLFTRSHRLHIQTTRIIVFGKYYCLQLYMH